MTAADLLRELEACRLLQPEGVEVVVFSTKGMSFLEPGVRYSPTTQVLTLFIDRPVTKVESHRYA